MKPAPILIFSYGNPSRGDDALGPAMHELLEKDKPDDVDLLTDFQLQIEHSIDLDQRDGILFIDASVSSSAPFRFYALQAERDDSYTSHAMSPTSLLDVYQQLNKKQVAPAFMLEIRGYEFGLGQPMSEQAEVNLRLADSFIRQLLDSDITDWPDLIINV